MNYEKRIKIKLYMVIFFVFLGAAAFSAGMYTHIILGSESYSAGYLTGTGTGLFVLGIIMFIKNISLLRNKEKLKAYKIECEDERNLALSFKASHYSLIITTILLYIVSFYLAFKNVDQLSVITKVICLLIFMRFIIYYLLKKRT